MSTSAAHRFRMLLLERSYRAVRTRQFTAALAFLAALEQLPNA